MTDHFFRILGLEPGAEPAEIKKAYRKMARRHHPDRFTDPKEKKKQEAVMARLNEAYETVQKSGKPPKKDGKQKKETDTDLYKEGVALFNRYTGSISLKFKDLAIDLDTLLEKKRSIGKSRMLFRRLLEEYPDSDWAYDAEDRLKKIEKHLPNLDTAIEFVRTHKLGRTDKGTPKWEKK